MSYRPYREIKPTGIEFKYLNLTGNTIPKATPVLINASGNIDIVDVSIESNVFALAGVTASISISGEKSPISTSGRIEDVGTSFTFGDPVFISKTGELTNIKPSIGVDGFLSGDYIIRVGVIVKNESNPLLKDLILMLNLVGQL